MAIYSISIRELRPKLPEVIADVSENMARYIITKRGKPAAIILNTSDYDSLVESLGLQSDEKLIKKISAAESGLKKKKSRPLEDIRKEIF